MKSLISVIWSGLPIFLIISACSSAGDAEQRSLPKIPPLTISTGNVGGGWYAISTTLAEYVNEQVEGYPITAIPGSGGMGNPIRVARKDSDIGLTFTPFLVMALEGQSPYQEEYSNLRAICYLSSSVNHFLVADHIQALTLSDVAEKKIGLKMSSGFPGDANSIILDLIFREFGVSEKDIRSWGGSIQKIGTSGRIDLWSDRHINAVHILSEVPSSAVTQALSLRKGKLLGLSEIVRESLFQRFGFVKSEIPAGTYPGQKDPIPTINLPIVLFTHDEISEEIVYIMTKTIAESEARLKKAFRIFHDWKAPNMIDHLGIEIHPGAKKYYQERGWLK